MAVTRKTFATPTEGVWTQAVSAAIPTLLVPILEWDHLATPTLKLLWELRRKAKISPDENGRERFDLRFEYGGGDFHYFTGKSHAIPIEVSEGLSAMHATPLRMGVGTSITIYDQRLYNAEDQLIDLAAFRMRQKNRVMTKGLNFEVWAKPLAADEGTDIYIDDTVTIEQTDVTIKDTPAITERLSSIPMIIRPHGTGHTFQGLASSNVMWRSHVYVGNATVQELNSTNFTMSDWAQTSGDNTDLVTTQATTTAIQFKAVDRVLEAMQRGGYYDILIACPTAIYGSLGRAMWSQQRGTQADPLYDIGIRHSFIHSSHNAIFYSEPILDSLHPNSLFFWDPDCLFFAVVEGFDPYIIPWTQIPDRTDRVFGKIVWGNLVCVDRRGTGALHGVKPD